MSKKPVHHYCKGKRMPRIGEASAVWPDSSIFIGLEVEAENLRYSGNSSLSDGDCDMLYAAGWRIDGDGSLRDDGREFKFASPLCGWDVTVALDKFFEIVSFSPSHRAGVHIHVDWTTTDDADTLATLMAIAYALEPALFAIAGEGRKESSFCRPLHELDPERLAGALRTGSFEWIYNNVLPGIGRYYGVNLASISKHGTVEFRHFPSLCDRHKIETWIKLVMLFRIAATNPELNPARVCELTSTPAGLAVFCEKYFGFHDLHILLLDNMDVDAVSKRMRLMHGLLRVKPVAKPQPPRGNPPALSVSAKRFVDKKYPELHRRREEAARIVASLVNPNVRVFDELRVALSRQLTGIEETF